MIATRRDESTLSDWRRAIRQCLPPKVRTIREFACQEIVLPTGPFEGRRFNCTRQPFAGLLLDELSRIDPATHGSYWRKVNTTGPQQCGKSLLGFVIPICYHLFEMNETVVVGVPSLDMVSDKWNEDILPVVERTRYRELLPARGGGSRGGRVAAVRFRNGATLRFMTGGGGDKTVAGFTTRVLIVTETDGFAAAKTTSKEADRLRQLEGRTRAYKDRRQIYHECTVTTEENPTWHQYQTGSASRILTPCPHCRRHVAMEREQLLGWAEAETEEEARRLAHWVCPACGQRIGEDDRVEMNRRALLVHRGQDVDESGGVVGPMPDTRVLGFRWSAFHNLFTDAAELAVEEWRGRSSADQENAEKALRQFIWCLPYVPQLVDDAKIDPKQVMRRTIDLPHNIIPADTRYLSVGVDLGKWTSWYLVLAFRETGQIHIPDYGVIEVHSDALQDEVAVYSALRDFREQVLKGWPVQGSGATRIPDAVWIDAGYLPAAVHQFCKESGTWPQEHARWFAAIGRGASALAKQKYQSPNRVSYQSEIRRIGQGWFLAKSREHRSFQFTFDADRWKLWFQAGLRIPIDQSGSVSLYSPGANKILAGQHNKLSRHFASEQFEQRMEEGKGLVQEWIKHGANHWLDCAAMASAAGNFLGFRLGESESEPTLAGDGGDWYTSQRKKTGAS